MDNGRKNANQSKKSKLKPGYIFDERMLLHRSSDKKDPEKPERALTIHMNLINNDLLKDLEILQTDYISDDKLLLVHTPNHIKGVDELKYEKATTVKRNELVHGYSLCYDSFDNYFTSQASRLAANSVIVGIDKVLKNKINGAFLVVRPPGHHSYPELASGFCFYNNVAIGARYAIKQHNLKRIAIIDWDVHHGNGTQNIFYDTNEVLFVSLHRYDKGLFYPFVKGNYTEIGVNEGRGFNINIPFNSKTFKENSIIGDEEYIYAFNTIVFPILKEYNPELIIVSCGFDAAKGDPLGKMSLTSFGYSYLINGLKEIVKERIVVVLEGGYNLKSLSVCSEAIVRTLIGEKLELEVNSEKINYENFTKSYRPVYYVLRDLNEYRSYFSKFWRNLNDNEIMFCKNMMFYYQDDHSNIETLRNYPNSNIVNYFFNGYHEIESILETNDFMKFKIGKTTFLEKSNSIKYIKHLLVGRRSGSLIRGFRVESVNISEFSINLCKYEANCEFNDENKLIRFVLILFKEKIDLICNILNNLLKEIESLCHLGIDLINIDLFIIKNKQDIIIKLNNLKKYSIVNDSLSSNICLDGLRNLIIFFKSLIQKNVN